MNLAQSQNFQKFTNIPNLTKIKISKLLNLTKFQNLNKIFLNSKIQKINKIFKYENFQCDQVFKYDRKRSLILSTNKPIHFQEERNIILPK